MAREVRVSLELRHAQPGRHLLHKDFSVVYAKISGGRESGRCLARQHTALEQRRSLPVHQRRRLLDQLLPQELILQTPTHARAERARETESDRFRENQRAGERERGETD